MFGVERSAPAYHASNLAKVEELRGHFASLSFEDDAAREYAEFRGHLTNVGTPFGPNDTLIAAIARVNWLTVVTNNTGEFGRVPDLSLDH